jgi:hypothetical protein
MLDFAMPDSSLYQRWLVEQAQIERVRKEAEAREGKEVTWEEAHWLWLTTEKAKWLKTQAEH